MSTGHNDGGYFDCGCCNVTEVQGDDQKLHEFTTVDGDDCATFLCDACEALGCGPEGDAKECVQCILDGARGIYVPRDFATGFTDWKGIKPEDLGILKAGPEHEFYWEAWDDVLQSAYFTDDVGRVWGLEQDSDLFAVAHGTGGLS
jgi:hypothetical protein